jgi:hypothetical protein
MPQWRKLHGKVVESVDVNDMPDDFARLLWVLLPTQLCCQGRGQDNPAWIRARVFPLRQDVTLDMVEAAMAWYAGRGMILRYQVAGRPYFQLANWSRYQGNTSREAPSDYPPPDRPLPGSCAAPDPLAPDSTSISAPCRSDSGPDADADSDADSDADADPGGGTPVPREIAGSIPRSAKKPNSPPAVLAFRRAAHRYPPKSWYADVDAAVGREEPDLQFWEDVVKEWVGHGWNPTNVSGMLECYRRRQLPGRGPRATDPPADPIQAAIQAIEEEGWT